MTSHLEQLAITTIMLTLAGAPALAQPNSEWVGGETGMAVHNTPSTQSREQVLKALKAAQQHPDWDMRLRDGYTPPSSASATAATRADVQHALADARTKGTNLNPQPQ